MSLQVQINLLMQEMQYKCVYFDLRFLLHHCTQPALRQEYTANRKKIEGKNIPEKTLKKMPALWMQIVDLCIDLPAAFTRPVHPSIFSPPLPDVIALHHTVISLFLPTLPSPFPPRLHYSSAPRQPYSPVKMIASPGVCVCVCV